MPRFLDKKLSKEYGEHSEIISKIMNSLGFMRGDKTAAKGRASEIKNADKDEAVEVKSKMMGKKHPAKPVTAEDKVMSKRHKEKREELSHDGKPLKATLKESDAYNLKHAKEHIDAFVMNQMIKKHLKG